ncbi:unknown [Prevotella sp. CAG:873]|nr:unknown [Prevotella sp. CAG:873]
MGLVEPSYAAAGGQNSAFEHICAHGESIDRAIGATYFKHSRKRQITTGTRHRYRRRQTKIIILAVIISPPIHTAAVSESPSVVNKRIPTLATDGDFIEEHRTLSAASQLCAVHDTVAPIHCQRIKHIKPCRRGIAQRHPATGECNLRQRGTAKCSVVFCTLTVCGFVLLDELRTLTAVNHAFWAEETLSVGDVMKSKPREVYLLAGGERQRREQPLRAVYALIGVLTGSGEYIHASPRVGYAYCLQGSVGGYGVLVTAHAVERPGFPIANKGQCGIEQINRINVMLGIITRQGVVRSRACRLGVHHHRAKIGHIIISHIRAARTEQLVGTTHDLARDAQRRRQYPAITHGLRVIIDAYAV